MVKAEGGVTLKEGVTIQGVWETSGTGRKPVSPGASAGDSPADSRLSPGSLWTANLRNGRRINVLSCAMNLVICLSGNRKLMPQHPES